VGGLREISDKKPAVLEHWCVAIHRICLCLLCLIRQGMYTGHSNLKLFPLLNLGFLYYHSEQNITTHPVFASVDITMLNYL
jgi:hypothetical protein